MSEFVNTINDVEEIPNILESMSKNEKKQALAMLTGLKTGLDFYKQSNAEQNQNKSA